MFKIIARLRDANNRLRDTNARLELIECLAMELGRLAAELTQLQRTKGSS